MKAVGFVLAGLAAAGVAIAAREPGAATARARVAASAPCSPKSGAVGTLTPLTLPKLLVNGNPWHSKQSLSLHAGDQIRSAKQGVFRFCLAEKGMLCNTIPGTRVKVMPTQQLLLRLGAGRASCRTDRGSTKTLEAGHA